MNTLAQRLGLNGDDLKREGKLFRLCADLGARILTPVPGEIAWRFEPSGIGAAEALAADWRLWPAFSPRTVWSRHQGHTWFAAEIEVPPEAAGRTFVLRFSSQWQARPGSTDPQCLAWLDGRIAQAIDGNHTELVVARNAVPGAKHTLLVDAFTFFDRPLVGFGVEYLVRNERIEKLYYDLMTPLEIATGLPQPDARRHAVLDRVDRALRALDRRAPVPDEADPSLDEAEAIAAEIYALADTEARPAITAVGHTHLDVGWLWRVMHTRDKTGRSFATVLALMAEYPRFVFMYNQAVLFDFLKTDYPEIWTGVKEKVAEGRFEIEGAMWVEPDVNIVSGESLVRQILFGRRFHIEEFGVTPKCVWLPDTFGYSANLPQIMEKSGLDYFVTSKLSWNDTDRHPYDTFFWRGIDGTETRAQLITAQRLESEAVRTTYNSDLSVSEVMGAWKRYEPKSAGGEVLICYGYGDGGGGPTRAMIERGIRLERGIPGAPSVALEGVGPFLGRLGARMEAQRESMPRWNGELYLQYHRGTLTSVAANKANNRRAERELRELEFLASLATATAGEPYPAEALEALWKTVLINQFHDILPGTSIPEVYADSDAEYAELFASLASPNGPLLSAARAAIRPGEGRVALVNFTSQDRSGELVLLDDPALEGKGLLQNGKAAPFQKVTDAGGKARYAAPAPILPSLGWAHASLAEIDEAPETTLSVSPTALENALVRIAFDANGEIASFHDKTRDRELIPPGATANRLVAYEDKPMNWDAWDIDWYFEEQSWPLADGPVSISVAETGPHRAALRIERKYRASRLVQIVSLAAGARQVEFDTFIDWHERQSVLKALFPFDLNTSEIRSEIQFGHVRRPTHRNTSWDRARFEASMHRWVDMSEPDFGAALINDCKYGYDAHEQLVRLTLLRSPIHPHPHADQGEHRLRYALLLHEGASDIEAVHHAAERFNNPVRLIGTPAIAPEPETAPFSLATVDCPNVTIETVKQAESGEGLVLRIFETANRRARALIRFGLKVRSARLVNLMEEGGTPVPVVGDTVTLSLRPFEIATLMIETG